MTPPIAPPRHPFRPCPTPAPPARREARGAAEHAAGARWIGPAPGKQEPPRDRLLGRPERGARRRLAPPVPAEGRRSDPAEVGTMRLERQSDNLRLVLRFVTPTAGAVFRRADTVWAVIETAQPIDVDAVKADPTHTISGVAVVGGARFPDRPHEARTSTARRVLGE